MKTLAVFGTVFAAFAVYLYALRALAEIHMDLTILAIHLVLDAHGPIAVTQTMLDAACLSPMLSTNFDTKLGLDPGKQHLRV